MLLAIDVGNSNTSVGLFGRDRELHFLATLDTQGILTVQVKNGGIFQTEALDASEVAW